MGIECRIYVCAMRHLLSLLASWVIYLMTVPFFKKNSQIHNTALARLEATDAAEDNWELLYAFNRLHR